MFNRIVRTPASLCGLLIVLTVLSVVLGESDLLGGGSSLVIVAITGLKAQLVIMYYMESRHFPKAWRRIYENWVYAAGAIILVGHYINFI